MPELAEVEYYRRLWDHVARGQKVVAALVHPQAKVFRGTDVAALVRDLTGARFLRSATSAKQMLFPFSGGAWLGIHLGMSGELRTEKADYIPRRHDHLVLMTAKHALVFTDPRMFGRILFHAGAKAPAWWTSIAPAILSPAFTVEVLAQFLKRRARAPIKAVLLMQERFPGIGNWMADEILWRACIHPRQLAGSLRPAEVRTLWRECRKVCRLAIATIAGQGGRSVHGTIDTIPDTWLFNHRWEPGGQDPRTGAPLAHATIGGRTTCWSPARQKLHP